MARIQAGSTLVNQYAPPFVVSDSVAQGWELQWNETLQAFEAVDPDANVINAGFDTIESAIFADVTQQVFVVPWTAASKESLIITIDGVKQHTDVYTIFADSASNTTTITLSDTVSNETVEVVGLQTTGGASINLFGPQEVDTVANIVDPYYTLGWFATTTDSVIVTVDGVKQHTNTYSVVPEPGSNYTQTRLTFSDRKIDFQADTGVNIAGDFITTDVAHGFETGAGVYYDVRGGTAITTTPQIADGDLLYVRSINAFDLELYDTKDNAEGAPATTGRVDITGAGGAETHTLTLVSGPYLSINPNLIALVNGGTGYSVGDTIKISGGTGATEAVITVLSETGGVIDAGVGVGFDLTLIGEYIVFPSPNEPAPTTTLTGVGASATFNIYPDRPKIEVVGITTTGETPASPVNATNLVQAGAFGLYDSKTVTNDTQVLNFKPIAPGSANVTIADAGSYITIDSVQATVDSIGADGGNVDIAIVPGGTNDVDIRGIRSGDRIGLSVTSGTIRVDYNLGYQDVSQGTDADPYVQLSTDKLIGITSLAAAQGITLLAPAAIPVGDTVTIKNQTASTQAITITPAAGQIQTAGNGALGASYVINTAYGYVTLYSDGTNYYIIAEG